MHTKEEKLAAFSRLLDVQERLRKECPWDRKQTNESLRPNTIEEVYELCDALLNDDKKNICKELGDVMEHVLFYSILGEETRDFDLADVCNKQADKLMFRHPFIDWTGWEGDPKQGRTVEVNAPTDNPKTEQQVEQTWEQIKQKEKDGNKTVLSGVPDSLPSLIKAYRIQDKARNVGFDWKQREDVWDKVREELNELEVELNQHSQEKATSELGDFLFSVINAARLYHLNPENALEMTNQKFIRRFNYVEQQTLKKGKQLTDMTLKEMDKLWVEAKMMERKATYATKNNACDAASNESH
ncbi:MULTISPECIES: nucleoside triphosphate pyrophosphohydrolase [Prevotellaceae]|uniref:nucleoside triphosphate pyrophosphohydrolase n=1 Tax=Prevotellaceae TaxID=171552 RepID=UPI000686C1C6|nr:MULTISPECIES: nucleoside triphosphate pyrophosphohydrolase [Prevotellaceae]